MECDRAKDPAPFATPPAAGVIPVALSGKRKMCRELRRRCGNYVQSHSQRADVSLGCSGAVGHGEVPRGWTFLSWKKMPSEQCEVLRMCDFSENVCNFNKNRIL